MECIISVSKTLIRCLFYSASALFCSFIFVPKLGLAPVFLDVVLKVVTPVGVSLNTDVIYEGCIVEIKSRRLPSDNLPRYAQF